MTSSHHGPPAESLFAEWLVQRGSQDAEDFDALCARHPDHETELRDLHHYWERTDRALRKQGLGGSLAERLISRYGSDVNPMVALEPESSEASDFSSDVLSRLRGRTPASTRYRLKGEVAHGGMGAVLLVWDEDLRRHLAMKVMLGKGSATEKAAASEADEHMLARFLEEAQVTGQLDHPGIVPVHELGLDADGQVFFTMKLVRGKTLGEVLDELSRGEGEWTQARVLGLLLKVCEAMSYAHDKGVIHRDLKPANVMVGRFGEVYVMDWGLAKVLGRDDERDIRVRPTPGLPTSELRTERTDRAGEAPDSPLYTMDGDVVGTPAYMSPEQAAGRVSEMGPPSDVYALGAMLYHLIAGHMPYVRPDERANNYAVWRWVKDGPPTSLEEEAPDAPAELVSICDRAMARTSAERYADMSALAADLLAYVEGRVVHAHEEGAWAEARKWVQRNRPLAASLAAVLVVTIGGLGGMSWVQAEGRAAEKEQRERADLKTAEAEANLELAQKNEEEAQARAAELEQVAAFQSEQLSGLDVEMMGVRLRRALIEAAPEERREELTANLAGLNFTNLALGTLEQNLFQRSLDAIDRQFADQPLVRARLLQSLAASLRKIGLLNLALGPQEVALAIRRAELGSEHVDTLGSIAQMGQLLSARGELTEAEPYVVEVLETSRRVLGDDHRETLNAIGNMGFLLDLQGSLEEAERYYRESLEANRRVAGNDHVATLNSIGNVGRVLMLQGRLEEAEPFMREAFEGHRRVHGEHHRFTLTALSNLGLLIQRRGRLEEAEPYVRMALDGKRQRLGDDHPETLAGLGNLGVLLQNLGQMEEAGEYYREDLERSRRLRGDDHPNTLGALHNMGFWFDQQGWRAEGEVYYREALEGKRRIYGDDHVAILTTAYSLGSLLVGMGRLEEAEPYLREALEGRRRILGEDHPDTLTSMSGVGHLLLLQGKLEEGELLLRESLERRRRVLGEDHRHTLSALSMYGWMLESRGELERAEPYYRTVLVGRKRLLDERHIDLRNIRLAVEDLARRLVAAARSDGDDLRLGEALGRTGPLMLLLDKPADAEQFLSESLDLLTGILPPGDPRCWIVQSQLGVALLRQSRFIDAEFALLESAEWFLANDAPSESEWLGGADPTTEAVRAVVEFYETRHAAEPGQGFDTQAATWRAKL